MRVYLRDKNKKATTYRQENKVPGVLYGPQIETFSIYAEEKDINKIYRENEFGFFEFEFNDKKFQGLLKEVQVHPLTDKIIHFDLYVPSLEKEIETKIPFEFRNESPVLKKGGILNFVLKELEVKVLPQNLPEKIIVDLSYLEEVGQSIFVKDLSLPKSIKVLIDFQTPIVTAIKQSSEINE